MLWNNGYNEYDYCQGATPFHPDFSPYSLNIPKPRKNWPAIHKENWIRSCNAKLNILRSNCGFNVGAYNCESQTTAGLNNYKEIIKLCVGNNQNIPVIHFNDSNVLLITIPEAVDNYFNLKQTTKFQIENLSGNKVKTFVYALKVPEFISKDVKMLCSSLLAPLKAVFNFVYEIDLFTKIEAVSPVKLKNTLELDRNLLDALIEVSKQVEDFNRTLKAQLDHYELISEPKLDRYKIGKSLIKNLSINEKITMELKAKLAPDKQAAIEKYFIAYKGLGMLNVDERRILEAVLILISNSQIVYATECPDTNKNFEVNKKVFLKNIVNNRHLKTAAIAEKLMACISKRVFLLVVNANYANFKTCVVTNLFNFGIKNDRYVFSVSSHIFREILAIKGSAFFIEREKGFYDACKSKNSLSVYNLLDYLDYLRHQPNSDDYAVPMKASLQTLLIRMDLYKYKDQGYRYIYEKFAAALSVAVKLKFIEDFSMTYEEFKEKLKNENTCSLGINVLKPPKNDILNQKNTINKDKMEVKNVKISD